MSGDRKKQFDEFIKNMRTEISDLDKKFLELSHLLRMRPSADDTKAYTSDTFLDKCYTINAKIHRFCQQTSVNINPTYEPALGQLRAAIESYTQTESMARQLIFPSVDASLKVDKCFKEYKELLEYALTNVREGFYYKT
jgi:hypothetical protein